MQSSGRAQMRNMYDRFLPVNELDPQIVCNVYPDVTPLSPTHLEFPGSAQAHESLHMPLGCVLNPFIGSVSGLERMETLPVQGNSGNSSRNTQTMLHSQLMSTSSSSSKNEISRCASCHAYLNAECELSQYSWTCCLCGHKTGFTRSQQRYKQQSNALLPEVTHPLLDVPLTFRFLRVMCIFHLYQVFRMSFLSTGYFLF